MLENMDLNRTLDKEQYQQTRDEIGARLGALQRACKDAGIPVLILFEGVPAAGKGLQINRLIQNFDPRGFDVYAARNAKGNEEETMRPFLWRFWTTTPANGRIAVYDRSWYERVSLDRFSGELAESALSGAYQDILSFERQLTDGGAVIIKLFLLISKKEQKHRFEKLEGDKTTAWRVGPDDWRANKKYHEYVKLCEDMLERTDTEFAPWTVIEASDKNFAAAKIMAAVAERLEAALAKKKNVQEMKAPSQQNPKQTQEGQAQKEQVQSEAPAKKRKSSKKSGQTMALERSSEPAGLTVSARLTETDGTELLRSGALSAVDLSKSYDKAVYREKLDALQRRLEELHSHIYLLRIPLVICFEGWDAAGKGGAIRRLTSHLDPRGYKVNPTAAPNDIERQHHYLWRFWNQMPKAGHIAIFDRTWYGRVMVERVEHFCSETEWKRAYREINEMEAHMVNFGALVLKFWLHIDKDEQERRFNERMNNPDKRWKITDEDWRNREKWPEYEAAVDEMLLRTSTSYAPWTIVAGNDKYYARIQVLETVVNALEKKIKSLEETQKASGKK